MEEDVRGGVYSTLREDNRHTGLVQELTIISEGKRHLGDVRVDGRIILIRTVGE
jgi:hypothetical protein